MLNVNLWVKRQDFLIKLSIDDSKLANYTTILISSISGRSSYIGQNAFGAKANVKSVQETDYGLALSDISDQRNDAERRKKASSTRGIDPPASASRTSENYSSMFSLSIPVKPGAAKTLKGDLAFYVDVALTDSDTVKGSILDISHVTEATISSPSEYYQLGRYLLSNIKEVGVYRKSTGEVLGWKKFE